MRLHGESSKYPCKTIYMGERSSHHVDYIYMAGQALHGDSHVVSYLHGESVFGSNHLHGGTIRIHYADVGR